jgi:imidazolonepropionase-like amidohydrolase
MDVATAKFMVEKNIWLSTQPFVSEDDTVPLTGQSRINLLQVIAGTERVYSLANEYKIKTAFGSDLLFSSKLADRQGLMLTHLTRWYDNADILRMATSINAELLAMSGARNPYEGALGVIEETALADLLVVDGNPIARIDIVARRKRTS